MVLRLFIPPGEGQHHLVPKRPDPLGANATLQYAVVGSTALAAGYTSFAAKFTRPTPQPRISRTALFIKSSARLGLWAVVAGAAVNAYYHKGFTSIVVAETVKDPTPPKLWEKVEKYTVEDGCLAGAAAGFVAFLPTLFMRRASVSWWARMVGMTNVGAGAGVVASHAYFQYTGERQKAMEELDRQRRRRTLEFHHIFWDKLLMAKFDPFIQHYVRHNGIVRAYHLPAEVYDAPEKFGISSTATTKNSPTTEVETGEKAPDQSYYTAAPDHAQHLRNLNVESVRNELENCEREKQALLKEAEYIAYDLSRRQYEFCHLQNQNEDDRQRRTRELQLINVAFNRLRANADELDRRIFIGNSWLKQKAAWESDGKHSTWLSHPNLCDPDAHDPSLSVTEMKKFQDQLTGEIKTFEARVRSQAREDVDKREKWKKDLEDARTMLRAADQVVFEMEKKVKEAADKGAATVVKVDEPPSSLEPEKP